MTSDLIQIRFPKFGTGAEQQIAYNRMKYWFDRNGYKYLIDYKFQWLDGGQYVPDYIWCTSDLALVFKLKYEAC